jgi:hypothetical protein
VHMLVMAIRSSPKKGRCDMLRSWIATCIVFLKSNKPRVRGVGPTLYYCQ